MAASDRLNPHWTNAIPAHALNPERMVEVQMLLSASNATD
jgi:hypothetical protein